ncbi:hypothetical protein CsSME_00010886 [Camellia sinensis var. sinensis]
MSFCLDFLIIHMVNDPKCKVYVLKFMLTIMASQAMMSVLYSQALPV